MGFEANIQLLLEFNLMLWMNDGVIWKFTGCIFGVNFANEVLGAPQNELLRTSWKLRKIFLAYVIDLSSWDRQ